MAVTLNKSTQRLSRLVVACLLVMLSSMAVLIGDALALRKARDNLVVDRELTDARIREVLMSCVQEYMASNPVSVASAPAAPSSPAVSFSACDFAYWVGVDGRPRCMIDGVECGVGDYSSRGVVLMIRPGRAICKGFDGSLVVVAKMETPQRADTDGVPSGAAAGAYQ